MIVKDVFSIISKVLPTKIAYAHCDIPCGIYDPNKAQLGAHTIIRMTELLNEIKRENHLSHKASAGQNETKAEHDIARLTHAKEDHGEMVEEELGTLENDYFKEEHFEKFTELKKLFADAIKLSIRTRQNIDIEAAGQLLEVVLKISEIFYKTKSLAPVRIKSPYPTGREIVVYKSSTFLRNINSTNKPQDFKKVLDK